MNIGHTKLLSKKSKEIRERLLPKKDVQHFVNKEGNKLKKLELFNSSILVVLAFLGFFVNAQLSSAQKVYATKQNAIEIQKFWSEIEKTLDNSVINSGKLGTYTVDFIGAADEVSQYYYLYYIITSTKNTGEQDYKLLSLKASLLSKYSRLVSEYERVALEYDFIRLKYHDVAKANNIQQWDRLISASEKVKEWKLENIQRISKIFSLVNGIEETGNVDNYHDLVGEVFTLSKEIGSDMNTFVPPYTQVISIFMDSNLRGNE